MDLGVNPYAAKDWLKARTALHLSLQQFQFGLVMRLQ